MHQKYPRIRDAKRQPDRKRDGSEYYGLPCVVCGKSTVGQMWVQVDWFRGNDELIRVCSEHWKSKKTDIIDCWISGRE